MRKTMEKRVIDVEEDGKIMGMRNWYRVAGDEERRGCIGSEGPLRSVVLMEEDEEVGRPEAETFGSSFAACHKRCGSMYCSTADTREDARAFLRGDAMFRTAVTVKHT